MAASALALAECTKAPNPDGAAAERAGGPAPSAGAVLPARDSTWVDVESPTVVAFFPPLSPAALDSGGDLAEALDDFGHHLSGATGGLHALGFRVEAIPGRTFHLVIGGRVVRFSVPKDSADIGYYFIAPGREPAVYYGVQTNAGLVESGRRFLGKSVP